MTGARTRLLIIAAAIIGGGVAVGAYADRPATMSGPGVGQVQTGDFGVTYRVDRVTRDGDQLAVSMTVHNPQRDDLSAIMDDAKVIADGREYDPDDGLAPSLDLQPLESESVDLRYAVPTDAVTIYVRLRGGIRFDVTPDP